MRCPPGAQRWMRSARWRPAGLNRRNRGLPPAILRSLQIPCALTQLATNLPAIRGRNCPAREPRPRSPVSRCVHRRRLAVTRCSFGRGARKRVRRPRCRLSGLAAGGGRGRWQVAAIRLCSHGTTDSAPLPGLSCQPRSQAPWRSPTTTVKCSSCWLIACRACSRWGALRLGRRQRDCGAGTLPCLARPASAHLNPA